MSDNETKRYWINGRLVEIRRSMFVDADAYLDAQDFYAQREVDSKKEDEIPHRGGYGSLCD